jgi:hypothetical protein
MGLPEAATAAPFSSATMIFSNRGFNVCCCCNQREARDDIMSFTSKSAFGVSHCSSIFWIRAVLACGPKERLIKPYHRTSDIIYLTTV